VSALGIDAEPDAALPVGVLEVIASHEERIRLREYWLVAPEISWDRLLFSAKESVYKALYPLTGRRLGFEDAAISFAPRSGAFCAHLSSAATEPLLPLLTELLQDGRVVLQGRWASSGGLVLTAIALSGARRCSPADRMRADGGEAGHDKSGA
jgi:4'-phosphopantetheinyl transferase EntD